LRCIDNAFRNANSGAMESMPITGQSFMISNYAIEMIWISAGSFQMGSPKTEEGRPKGDQELLHTVRLTKGFWLGKYEVTQDQWQAVMESNPSYFKQGRVIESHFFGSDIIDNKPRGNYPVESVSWNDIMDFCKRLTEKERVAGRLPEGYEYSLPTEAQWEYACRAGTNTAFCFGDYEGKLWQYGNYCDSSTNYDWRDKNHNDGYDDTAPVGSFQPNAWGLYDMHGNVAEMCYDWYSRVASLKIDPGDDEVSTQEDLRPFFVVDRGTRKLGPKADVSIKQASKDTGRPYNDIVDEAVVLKWFATRLNTSPEFVRDHWSTIAMECYGASCSVSHAYAAIAADYDAENDLVLSHETALDKIGFSRISRGGSWSDDAESCRSACRSEIDSWQLRDGTRGMGIRLALRPSR
jgi:formylglycine-generating enzyme required for sulfatase activity